MTYLKVTALRLRASGLTLPSFVPDDATLLRIDETRSGGILDELTGITYVFLARAEIRKIELEIRFTA